uniref:Zinc finger protein 710 n=1 Tax=Latimeria chalumnae TaxID=7897 RepID=H3BEV6_LATCH
MEYLMEAETQTDPVVVLSLAQAAILGLVSQTELFGATVKTNGFHLPTDCGFEVSSFVLPDCDGVAAACPGPLEAPATEQLEEECWEVDVGLTSSEKQARRKRRQPVKVVHEVKMEMAEGKFKGDGCPENEGSTAEQGSDGDELPSEGTIQRAVKMIDLSGFRRKLPQRRVWLERHRDTQVGPLGMEFQEASQLPPPCDALQDTSLGNSILENAMIAAECFESLQPSSFGPAEAPAPEKQGEEEEEEEKTTRSFIWQPEQSDLEPDPSASHSDRNRRAQLDRLDINVQIDDSYYVDSGDGQKRWQCRMCEKSYTSKYNLVTHILGHNGIKPHSCPYCSKLFKQPSHLQTHLLTHQGMRHIKPYSCRFCSRGFAYPSELKSHEAKHQSGRCHVCVECGLDFATLTQLKRHLTAHQGPTPYQCAECNKSFHYRSQLQNHMLKHQNIRPFVCTECGMEFAQVHHLRQHSLTHKGVKEFKCEVCGREFTLQANMKRHMLIHASVRPYQCHICFKTFVQKQTLKTHMIVHSPVKPFKCKVCGKMFNRMYNLLGHMHLHAGSKPFKCPYCSSKFNLKGNLSRHMKIKHGVMDITMEGQDNIMDLGPGEQADLVSNPDLENYEQENSYGFSADVHNGADSSMVDVSKLTDENTTAMKDVAYQWRNYT